MAIETWIDNIAALAGEITAANARTKVRSYRCFTKAEFPAAISDTPCAVTYPVSVVCNYSDGGPWQDIWEGKTEFYLAPDTNPAAIPEVIRYFAKIRNAFALHRQLGVKVAYCVLRTDGGPSIEGPVGLKFGSSDTEPAHWGLVAHWIVKEDVTGDYTLGS